MPSGGNHNILSATHLDALADTVIAGDLIYGNATPKWARLPKGTDGQYLKLVTGLPAWSDSPAGADHNLLSATHLDTLAAAVVRGDILIGNSTPKWARLALTANRVLKSDALDVIWGLIVNADVDAAAGIAESKLALNYATHARQHVLNSASDHTGTLTTGQHGTLADGSHSNAKVTTTLSFAIVGTLTVGIDKAPTILAPCTLTIVKVKLVVKTAPTGAAIIIDVNKNGTTIFTTQANRPQIAAGATQGDSGTPDVTALAEGDKLTIDIDQIGSTIAGADLTVEVVCTQTITWS